MNDKSKKETGLRYSSSRLKICLQCLKIQAFQSGEYEVIQSSRVLLLLSRLSKMRINQFPKNSPVFLHLSIDPSFLKHESTLVFCEVGPCQDGRTVSGERVAALVKHSGCSIFQDCILTVESGAIRLHYSSRFSHVCFPISCQQSLVFIYSPLLVPRSKTPRILPPTACDSQSTQRPPLR